MKGILRRRMVILDEIGLWVDSKINDNLDSNTEYHSEMEPPFLLCERPRSGMIPPFKRDILQYLLLRSFLFR